MSVTMDSLMKDLIRKAHFYRGKTFPNPATGAMVISSDGRVISEGFHERYGTDHAEVCALKKAGSDAQGATMLVTLEPCTHFGQTPPCTDAIIRAGISRVIYAEDDPNPKVRQLSSKERMEKAGITVIKGVCREEARALNPGFYSYYEQKRPYITLKAAQSSDNKLAKPNGDSLYITSEESRREVHRLRRLVQGIIVGSETILHDDPALNVRFNLLENGFQNPAKFIIDRRCRIPHTARVFTENTDTKLYLVTDQKRDLKLFPSHVSLITASFPDGQLDWGAFVSSLRNMGIQELLLEGGKQLYISALEAGVVSELVVYKSPVILGGDERYAFDGVSYMSNPSQTPFGPDLQITGRFLYT